MAIEVQNSLAAMIAELDAIFAKLNKKLFDNKLPKPVITVSTRGKRKTASWFTPLEPWKTSKDAFHEINICAEYLNENIFDICMEILHEMVHYLNFLNNVKDSSRSASYHNDNFRIVAEKHGLIAEYTPKHGFSKLSFTPSTKEYIETLGLEDFNLYREFTAPQGTKQSSLKYICPICGTIIRANCLINARCVDCDCAFVLVSEAPTK